MSDKAKGIIFIILGAVFFGFMNTCFKLVGDLPTMQKVFFRNFFAFILSFILLVRKGEQIRSKNFKFVLLRSILGYLGIVTNVYAVSKLMLADANILLNTNPFFIIVFSVLCLKEPLKRYHIPTLLLALLGAVLVIKPQFNYTIIPSLIGLSAGMFAGSAYTTVRYLSKYDNPQIIVVYFSGISVLITIPFLIFGPYIPPTPLQWLILLGVGIFGTIAQFFITYAYRYAPASELSIYNYAQILVTLLLGMIIWHEIPDVLSISGGALIVLAGYINYAYSKREEYGEKYKSEVME